MAVSYNNRGYVGQSRSVRATEAERNGKLPLTRAIPVVAERAACSRKVAREALLATYRGEWHHVNKYARRTDYYDCTAAVNWLRCRPIVSRLPADWNEQLESALAGTLTERTAALDSAAARIASAADTTAAVVLNIYYETWGDDGDWND